MTEQPSPPFQNPDTHEFWAAVQNGRIVYQRCRDCRSAYSFPRPFCIKCFSDNVELVDHDGTARIHAKTIVRIPAQAGGEQDYTVVLIEIVNGVRMLARYTGEYAYTGEHVHLSWDLNGDKPRLVAHPTT